MTTESRMGDCPHGLIRALCPACAPRWDRRRKRTDQDALSLAHSLNEQSALMAEYGYSFGHAKEPPVTLVGVNEDAHDGGSVMTRAYEDDHNRAVERELEGP